MPFKDIVWVRWEGNKSARYDGKVEGVPRSSITKTQGRNVTVKWGKKLWYGVLEDSKKQKRESSKKQAMFCEVPNSTGTYYCTFCVHVFSYAVVVVYSISLFPLID